MKKIVVFCFLMVALLGVEAQEGPVPSSGIGIIFPEKNINERCLNFPLARIELFDAPGGEKAGFITKKNSLNLMYQVAAQNFPFRVQDKDLAELAPLAYCLKIFAREGDFVKVLVNSTKNGYWISLKEIGYLRFSAMLWIDWMKTQKGLFYPMVDMGINLRSAANPQSNKLALLKGPLFAIQLTGKTEGSWAEVTASRYASPPCKNTGSNAAPIETKSGWLKVLDDAGMPNIWFYPRGCR
jgi:hypothetical protein